ncbi:lysophospholipid acyltransferase family protein [Planobispora siamensis]|uniref:Phospholipid/glycerol acyltransferase domain-containing protein n=1 Tax=Planobispora siamensis TaxID=936338 RepID=A0A8J3WJP2_9ACTN|nr:lysophospholipid acyltransferase family protein [Planobispora siamensis]GIH90887.1 hypothetical protein Psi01_15170 [Planobispora siamensis]
MSPWLPPAPCTPPACVLPPVTTAVRPLRVLRLLAAAVLILVGPVLALVALGSGTARRTALTGAWSRLMLWALGVRIEVRRGFTFLAGSSPEARVPARTPAAGAPITTAQAGTTSGAAALFVANHVSWLDPLVMAAALPCRLLAKREVLGWPLVGGLAAASGALFIDRERLSALPRAVADVAGALAAGEPVAAFPEGTTRCGREMGAFRPAVFQAALDAGAPVRPVAIRYLDASGAPATGPAFIGDDTLMASLLRVVAFRRLTVEVTLLPPVTAHDRRTLAWAAESSVASVVVAVPVEHGVPVAA